MSAFRRDPLALFEERSSPEAAPLVQLNLGPSPVYLVTDAPLAKTVLRADEATIDKGRLVHKLRTVIGTSSITLSGAEHQRRRAIIHQHLARGIMNDFVPQITGLIRRQASLLICERSFDAHEVTAPLALRMIVALLFGHGALTECDESALMEAVHVAEEEMADSLFRILPRTPWRSFLKRRELRRSRAIMGAVVDRVRGRAKSGTLVQALQALDLSPDDMRDEILLLLLAGHHTTGNAAAWLLYYLATEPGVTERLAAEAEAITDYVGEIDPLRLPKAETSLRVAREVLRLYPPFYWFSREIRTPQEIAGLKLKPGTSLIISPWQLQRDARYWCDPAAFRLDRAYNTPAFMPFGLGPRACVGIGLGLLELQLLALELSASCSVEILSNVPADKPTPQITLLPPHIELRLRPRVPMRRQHVA
ncbi:cytochrome P450 (plasmid) [Bradyrhizobium japonicum]|nr:cytochrome P450 [Bradyrhizobium japonicum]